jgi:hypothetical protein
MRQGHQAPGHTAPAVWPHALSVIRGLMALSVIWPRCARARVSMTGRAAPRHLGLSALPMPAGAAAGARPDQARRVAARVRVCARACGGTGLHGPYSPSPRTVRPVAAEACRREQARHAMHRRPVPAARVCALPGHTRDALPALPMIRNSRS